MALVVRPLGFTGFRVQDSDDCVYDLKKVSKSTLAVVSCQGTSMGPKRGSRAVRVGPAKAIRMSKGIALLLQGVEGDRGGTIPE